MFLIDDLLLLPIDGMKFVFRTLAKAAEEQWTDDAPLKEQLMELQVKLENGEVSEEEYISQEAHILAELREVGRRKRSLAGVTEEQEQELSGGLPSPTGEAGTGMTFTIESNLGPADAAAAASDASDSHSPESAPAISRKKRGRRRRE